MKIKQQNNMVSISKLQLRLPFLQTGTDERILRLGITSTIPYADKTLVRKAEY